MRQLTNEKAMIIRKVVVMKVSISPSRLLFREVIGDERDNLILSGK